MLIEFRVENHRSLQKEQVLTMEVGRLDSSNDPRGRTVHGHNERLLPAAAIYGANASGKSNVLSAIGFFRDAVIDSHSSWPAQGGVPRDAFAWGGLKDEPSLFEAKFLVEGVRYQYGFVVDQSRVLEEWLFAWPKGRRQTWIEREGDNFEFGDKFRGENQLIEQVTRSNALFLSTAAQHKHQQLLSIYKWFKTLHTVRVEGYKERYFDAMPAAVAAAVFAAAAAGAAAVSESAKEMIRVRDLIPMGDQAGFSDTSLSDEEAGADNIRKLIKIADVGIMDFRVEKARNKLSKLGKDKPRILVRHETDDGEGWLPLEQESAGTKAMFHLGPAVTRALDCGSLLVVDELETSLHPLAAMRIVQMFNSPLTNPKNAQIVFATHDTNLLSMAVGELTLRRDQIWLTEKGVNGATTLYPLTDYKPRKAENLERGYLQGRYGAIPFLGNLDNIVG